MGSALLIVLFVALIVAGAVVYTRARARDRSRTGPGRTPRALEQPARPVAGGQAAASVRTLGPGDVVLHDGADFIVEGTVRLEEGGFEWAEHRLVAGERTLWLSVEDDEGLEVVVWRRLPGSELEPGAQTVSVEGVDYALEERSTARFTAQGSTGTGASGTVAYADYEAGDRRLAFERFGDESGWEVSTGQVVSEHAFDVYPGRGLDA